MIICDCLLCRTKIKSQLLRIFEPKINFNHDMQFIYLSNCNEFKIQIDDFNGLKLSRKSTDIGENRAASIY